MNYPELLVITKIGFYFFILDSYMGFVVDYKAKQLVCGMRVIGEGFSYFLDTSDRIAIN
jgi:hypothetical protein